MDVDTNISNNNNAPQMGEIDEDKDPAVLAMRQDAARDLRIKVSQVHAFRPMQGPYLWTDVESKYKYAALPPIESIMANGSEIGDHIRNSLDMERVKKILQAVGTQSRRGTCMTPERRFCKIGFVNQVHEGSQYAVMNIYDVIGLVMGYQLTNPQPRIFAQGCTNEACVNLDHWAPIPVNQTSSTKDGPVQKKRGCGRPQGPKKKQKKRKRRKKKARVRAVICVDSQDSDGQDQDQDSQDSDGQDQDAQDNDEQDEDLDQDAQDNEEQGQDPDQGSQDPDDQDQDAQDNEEQGQDPDQDSQDPNDQDQDAQDSDEQDEDPDQDAQDNEEQGQDPDQGSQDPNGQDQDAQDQNAQNEQNQETQVHRQRERKQKNPRRLEDIPKFRPWPVDYWNHEQDEDLDQDAQDNEEQGQDPDQDSQDPDDQDQDAQDSDEQDEDPDQDAQDSGTQSSDSQDEDPDYKDT